MSALSRLINVFRSRRLDQALDTEIETHIRERADDLVATGMSHRSAEFEARRRFGNRGIQHEAAHEADTLTWLESVFNDIRYALRTLRNAPLFTLIAVLSLGLGIGANTAIFSLVDAVTLKALPVNHPEELALLNEGGKTFTNPLWEAIRARDSIFAGAFAYSWNTFDLADGGVEQHAIGSQVSGGYFGVLGVRAAAGRLLGPDDDRPGCPLVAVLSGGFAASRFGSAAAAVGRTMPINGHPATIIGVTNPRFTGLEVGRHIAVFMPLCAEPILTGRPDVLAARSRWFLDIMVRALPGMTIKEVNTQLAGIAPAVYQETVPGNWGTADQHSYLAGRLAAHLAPAGQSELRDAYASALRILMIVVGAVLLIACANIAALLAARAASRQREMAIRLAIGAAHRRLIRQLLTESITLAAAGAVVGVLFARWSTRLLVAMLSTSNQPVGIDLSIDGRVLLFTILVTTLAGIGFGLLPAWRAARTDPQTAMKSGGRVRGDSRRTLGHALVTGQVALSLLLIACAGLLVGSFRRLVTLDPGFHRDGVLLASMDFGRTGWKDRRLIDEPMTVLARIRSLPGVSSASLSWITPIGRAGWNDLVMVPGYRPTAFNDSLAYFNQVSPGYFRTMGSRLIAGRDFTDADVNGARSVAIISQTMATRVFGTASPIGRTFQTPVGDTASPPREVIGVVEDSRYNSLTEKPRAVAWFPYGVGDVSADAGTFEIRTSGSMAGVTRDVARIAAQADPRVGLSFTTLSRQVDDSLTRPRLLALLSGFFGMLALALAMIGLYGTVAYNVTQRKSEIGVRIALGAGQPRVLRMIVREASLIVIVGVSIGLLLAVAGTRVMKSFLYGVTATDPATLAAAALLLVVTGLVAAAIPALRASRLDPTAALRED